MQNHLKELLHHYPHLLTAPVLDLGAGRGRFLIELTLMGGKGEGLEFNKEYIKEAEKRAKEAGVSITLREGRGEALPFKDASFAFANLSEVIEHVEDPKKVLSELHRVLLPGGGAYMSVPNRFGLRDPHYHLYFINWLPRTVAETILRFLGKIKEEQGEAGRQKLSDMHYMIFSKVVSLCHDQGFSVVDIREKKLKEKFPSPLVHFFARRAYKIARTCYFDSFHLLITRP